MLRFSEPKRRKIRGIPSRNYSSQVYDTLTRRRSWQTTGTDDLEVARAWVHAMRMRAALGELAPLAEERLAASAALDRWLASERPRLRARTIGDLESHIRMWKKAWGTSALRDVDSKRLERHLEARRPGRKPRTLNHEISLLSWFFSWAEREQLLARNPSRVLRRYRVPRRAVRVLSPDEEERLFSSLAPSMKPIVGFAIETGLRRGTLLQMRWEHISDDGWLRIEAEYMKGDGDFQVPISDRAIEALREARRQTLEASPAARVFPLERSQVNRLFRRATHAAGIQGLRFHDLRKTFCTRALQRGVPLETVATLSDHKDLRVLLEIYRSISPIELLKAVGRKAREIGGAAQGILGSIVTSGAFQTAEEGLLHWKEAIG